MSLLLRMALYFSNKLISVLQSIFIDSLIQPTLIKHLGTRYLAGNTKALRVGNTNDQITVCASCGGNCGFPSSPPRPYTP